MDKQKITHPDYHKEYYQNNKEYFKKYSLIYYQNNKEKYKQKVECCRCGKLVHRSNLSRHQKSHLCLTKEEKENRLIPLPGHSLLKTDVVPDCEKMVET